MTSIINIEKFNIYESYHGNIDGICRNNRPSEKAIFGDKLNTTWAFITDKIHELELISKRQTSYDYTKKSLTDLHETTDNETFKLLTTKIPFYSDFQFVKQLLEKIKSLTTEDASTVWAGFDNGKEFLAALNTDIEKIKFCDFVTLEKLNIDFAPTSTYQELSLSNGWSDDYLILARQFDNLYKKIMKQGFSDDKKVWWKSWKHQ